MKLRIAEAAPFTTKEFGYTHRIQVEESFFSNVRDEIGVWLTVNNIDYIRAGYSAYYLGPEDATAFIMRFA